MVTRLFNPLIARFAAIAALMALMAAMAVAPLATTAATPTKFDYDENGTELVARFDASDEEGDTITWGLDGEDKGDFEISDAGVLTFKESPDFEKPADKNMDNVYKVTITATGTGKTTHAVEVTVIDLDEPGKVTLTKPQPQVSRGLAASYSDPDGGQDDIKWQWSRGPNVDGPWTDIDKATSATRNPVADDVGSYLRATVTYTDKFGKGKTASAVSENAVEARTVANAAPSFAAHDTDDDTTGVQAERTVNENAKGANVGKPVSATDGDDDVLLYTLGDGDTDTAPTAAEIAEWFSIDSRTGQITTKIKLDSHIESANADTDANERKMKVLVTATDPSGAPGTAVVEITINNINDAPVFADATGTANQSKATAAENQTAVLDGDPDTTGDQATNYSATDDDANTTLTYAVTGADAKYFFIPESGGELAFCVATNIATRATDSCTEAHSPDYEKKSAYSITITADDSDKGVATRDVTVTVTNANDVGKVALTAREPQIDIPVLATLTDPDGGIGGVTWQWYKATADTNSQTCSTSAGAYSGTPIPGATSASYTPVDDDEHSCLRAVATYNDTVNTSSTTNTSADTGGGFTDRNVQKSDPANTAPKFADDQDLNTPGEQADAERSVVENSKDAGTGNAVTADDTDLLIYTLSGADSDSFKIGRGTGSITTAEKLDYETKSTYTVVVTATDPSGATDSINVNISVTDVNDVAVITGGKTVDYAENGTGDVATYSASDQDADALTWGLDGADKALFEISDAGVLTFKKSPNYEKAADVGTDNIYKVTVTATGGDPSNTGELKVEITVTDVDEAGKVSFEGEGMYQPQVGRTLTASGPADEDGGVTDQRWQWARSSDMETWADIDKATSEARTPVADDVGSYLRATITYTDKFGEGKTASMVSDNPVEARTVANARPSFKGQDETASSVDDNAGAEGSQDYIIVTREVNENTAVGANVGKPVSATDGDNDVLVYSLDWSQDLKTGGAANEGADTGDARFTIDSASGQIKIGKELNYEAADDHADKDEAVTLTADQTGGAIAVPSSSETADPQTAANEMYVLRVRATDPSGAYANVNVTVTLKNVNDAPMFPTADAPDNQAAVAATENDTEAPFLDANSTEDGDQAPTYTATDQDGDTNITFAVTGADAGNFELTGTGLTRTLVFKDHTPNYEKKKSYSITITADDDKGGVGSRDVTVTVTNVEDTGTVSLSQREPQIGRAVVATLKEEDGGISGETWVWHRATAALTGTQTCRVDANWPDASISGANSPSYTPVAADENRCLRATVTYTDAFVTDTETPVGDDGDSAVLITERPVEKSDPANTAPKFADDQDLAKTGNQPDAERSVAENAKDASVGDPVIATDADKDLLIYTLSGADADSFTIVSGLETGTGEGQIKTKVKLDYETKSSYTVVVTATDPSGASDTVTVNITVTDVNDAPVITPVTGNSPEFADETTSRSVAENTAAGTAIGDPVMATDADGETLSYTLGGDDAGSFDIDGDSGQIMTSADLDYETKSEYMVTVTAADGTATDDASIAVTITVTDEGLDNPYDANEDGAIQRDEVIAAIHDYLAEEIERADVIALITLYFTAAADGEDNG